jgi:hypothetical protein
LTNIEARGFLGAYLQAGNCKASSNYGGGRVSP